MARANLFSISFFLLEIEMEGKQPGVFGWCFLQPDTLDESVLRLHQDGLARKIPPQSFRFLPAPLDPRSTMAHTAPALRTPDDDLCDNLLPVCTIFPERTSI